MSHPEYGQPGALNQSLGPLFDAPARLPLNGPTSRNDAGADRPLAGVDTPPAREGLRREHAKDLSAASFTLLRGRVRAGDVALPIDALRYLYIAARHPEGVTDHAVAERLTKAKGRPVSNSRAAARRADLVKYDVGPLIERAGDVFNEATRRKNSRWRITDLGRIIIINKNRLT